MRIASARRGNRSLKKNNTTHMAQGKEFTKEQREKILESLKPYLKLGYSVNKACILAEVEPSTVYRWLRKDETLSRKVTSWQNMITAMARRNVVSSIRGKKDEDGNYIIKPDVEQSKWWLERQAREEFGRNVDITTDNEKLPSGLTAERAEEVEKAVTNWSNEVIGDEIQGIGETENYEDNEPKEEVKGEQQQCPECGALRVDLKGHLERIHDYENES